jgi:fatty-acyl-CoA synthase
LKQHFLAIVDLVRVTETSPVSFQSATDDPLERRVSTVGRIQPISK